jgi:hypothetical protein
MYFLSETPRLSGAIIIHDLLNCFSAAPSFLKLRTNLPECMLLATVEILGYTIAAKNQKKIGTQIL